MRRRWQAPFGTVGYGLALAVVWVLLWGSWSAANVLSGLAVAFVLIAWLVPSERRRPQALGLRPVALVRLGVFLLRQLVTANLMLAREVVAPRSRLRTGVVGVPLQDCSEQVISTLANFIALAPGSMPVELKTDPTVLYVHILHLDDLEHVRSGLLELRDLTVRALGSAAAVAALEDRR